MQRQHGTIYLHHRSIPSHSHDRLHSRARDSMSTTKLLSAKVDQIVLLLQAVMMKDASHVTHISGLVGVLTTESLIRSAGYVAV